MWLMYVRLTVAGFCYIMKHLVFVSIQKYPSEKLSPIPEHIFIHIYTYL